MAAGAKPPLGQDRPVAVAALFLRRGGAQLQWPIGPDERLVFVFRRFREYFELGDRPRALAGRSADAVRAGIAAADHDDMLPFGGDRAARRGNWLRVAGDALVLLRQEIH